LRRPHGGLVRHSEFHETVQPIGEAGFRKSAEPLTSHVRSLMRFISKWWYGKEHPATIAKIGDRQIIITGGTAERHWTANIVRGIVDFYIRNWQWLFGSLIIIVLAVYFGK